MILAYPDNVPRHPYENLQAQHLKTQKLAVDSGCAANLICCLTHGCLFSTFAIRIH